MERLGEQREIELAWERWVGRNEALSGKIRWRRAADDLSSIERNRASLTYKAVANKQRAQ